MTLADFFEAFHFVRPAALLLVPLAAGVWWAWRTASDPLRGWRQQIDPDLLRAFVVGDEATGRSRIGTLVAWSIAAVAVAGPTWRLEPSPFADDAAPLVVLLEAGATMEVADPAPTRLERARLKIDDLAQARAGQPLGLVAYAGSAHLVLPPTRDTGIVATMAAEIGPDVMPADGDRLDLALAEVRRALGDGATAGSALVLTDSVSADPEALEAFGDLRLQFLTIAPPDTPEEASVRTAAEVLGASVTQIDLVGSSDVDSIVRRAASAPVAKAGEDGARWQEAGYALVPVLALLALLSFRREEHAEEPA